MFLSVAFSFARYFPFTGFFLTSDLLSRQPSESSSFVNELFNIPSLFLSVCLSVCLAVSGFWSIFHRSKLQDLGVYFAVHLFGFGGIFRRSTFKGFRGVIRRSPIPRVRVTRASSALVPISSAENLDEITSNHLECSQ